MCSVLPVRGTWIELSLLTLSLDFASTLCCYFPRPMAVGDFIQFQGNPQVFLLQIWDDTPKVKWRKTVSKQEGWDLGIRSTEALSRKGMAPGALTHLKTEAGISTEILRLPSYIRSWQKEKFLILAERYVGRLMEGDSAAAKVLVQLLICPILPYAGS